MQHNPIAHGRRSESAAHIFLARRRLWDPHFSSPSRRQSGARHGARDTIINVFYAGRSMGQQRVVEWRQELVEGKWVLGSAKTACHYWCFHFAKAASSCRYPNKFWFSSLLAASRKLFSYRSMHNNNKKTSRRCVSLHRNCLRFGIHLTFFRQFLYTLRRSEASNSLVRCPTLKSLTKSRSFEFSRIPKAKPAHLPCPLIARRHFPARV